MGEGEERGEDERIFFSKLKNKIDDNFREG